MKTFTYQIARIIFPFLFLILLLSGCKKENPASGMAVKMTGRSSALQVYLDVRYVEVHYQNKTTENDGWVTLTSHSGIYSVSGLNNTISTLIGEAENIPEGNISEIQLVLGDKNSLAINQITTPVELIDCAKKGIKMKVNTTVKKGMHTDVILYFDAKIHETQLDSYLLEPIIEATASMRDNR